MKRATDGNFCLQVIAEVLLCGIDRKIATPFTHFLKS